MGEERESKWGQGKGIQEKSMLREKEYSPCCAVEVVRRIVSRSKHPKATLDSLTAIYGEASKVPARLLFPSLIQHIRESRLYLQNAALDHYTDELQKPVDQRSIFHSQPL